MIAPLNLKTKKAGTPMNVGFSNSKGITENTEKALLYNIDSKEENNVNLKESVKVKQIKTNSTNRSNKNILIVGGLVLFLFLN